MATETKFCNKCETTKDVTFFSRRGTKYQPWCKKCSAEHNKLWNANNKAEIVPRRKINSRKNRYGLTEQSYQQLLEEQNYLCACCKLVPPVHVDHDHACCPDRNTCGKCVRGLLCSRCNTFIGYMEKTPNLVLQANSYINSPLV